MLENVPRWIRHFFLRMNIRNSNLSSKHFLDYSNVLSLWMCQLFHLFNAGLNFIWNVRWLNSFINIKHRTLLFVLLKPSNRESNVRLNARSNVTESVICFVLVQKLSPKHDWSCYIYALKRNKYLDIYSLVYSSFHSPQFSIFFSKCRQKYEM